MCDRTLAYPFNVGASPLAHVNVAFFTVMLFVPPAGKHRDNMSGTDGAERLSVSKLLFSVFP